MKYLMYAVIIFFSSCKTTGEEMKPKVSELKIFLQENLNDTTDVIDSFAFIRLDTLYLRDKYANTLDDALLYMKHANKLLEFQLNKMKNSAQLSKLSYYVGSSTLGDQYKESVMDEKKEFDKLAEKMNKLTLLADSLSKLYQNTDSTIVSGYQAVCSYQLRKKDMSVMKDTAYIILNLDKNIIRASDYFLPLKSFGFDPKELTD